MINEKSLSIKKTNSLIKFDERLKNKNKKNFEIVISRFDEDISWSYNYKDFTTIYNKGKDDIPKPYIKLENKGQHADTILKHIINNYDNLADVTFFTHGSLNCNSNQIIKKSGKCHKYSNDFISLDKDTLMFIPRIYLPSANEKLHNYYETVSDVYKYIFKTEYKRNFLWACDNCISVSKERIRKTPLEVYKRMLQFILKSYKGKEPTQDIYKTRGIYIERFILKCFT